MRRQGYTLMEVLIATVILAMVMTILLGTQANQVQIGSTANQMGTASLLGQAKMLEVESEMLADGLSEGTQKDSGTFRKEGFAQYNWEVVIDPVEIDDASQEALLGEANGKLFGEGEDGGGGSFTGNAAFASYLPMVVGLLPDFINRLGEKVRKVTLTITWENVRGEQTLTLVQYVTDLDGDESDQQGGGPGAVPGGLPGGAGGLTPPAVPGLGGAN